MSLVDNVDNYRGDVDKLLPREIKGDSSIEWILFVSSERVIDAVNVHGIELTEQNK